MRKTKTVKCNGITEARDLLAEFIVEVKSGEYIETQKTAFGDFVMREWLPKYALKR